MTTRRLLPVSLLLIALNLISGSGSVCSSLPLPLSSQDQAKLTTIYQAGLHGDKSAIPYVIAALRCPGSTPAAVTKLYHLNPLSQIDPIYTHTALRAAVRLQATQVLPEIKALIGSNDPDARALARVTKARLLADAATNHIQNPRARAAAEISHFYTELGLTSSQINNELANYNQQPVDDNGQPTTRPLEDTHFPTTGVYAMREIADMLYVNDYRNYVSLPSVAPLNITDDLPSMIKRRFARGTQTERISALLEDLSHRDSGVQWDPQQNYVLQLAEDEGPPATLAAVKKLEQMETKPAQYPAGGFHNLIDLIGNTGSQAQAEDLDKIQDARPQVVNHLHAAAEQIRQGQQNMFVAGY